MQPDPKALPRRGKRMVLEEMSVRCSICHGLRDVTRLFPRRLSSSLLLSKAKVMSELYARIARACGAPLLEEIWSPNCHERFDASLENATRTFASVTHESRELPRVKEPVPGRLR